MQQELTAFKSSLGGLMRVPEGREIALDNLELLANYKAKIGEIAGNRGLSINDRMDQIYHLKPPHLKTMQEVPGATGASGPKEGDRKQFKQGWGVFRGGQWVPASP
jgi:hypothetical protein